MYPSTQQPQHGRNQAPAGSRDLGDQLPADGTRDVPADTRRGYRAGAATAAPAAPQTGPAKRALHDQAGTPNPRLTDYPDPNHGAPDNSVAFNGLVPTDNLTRRAPAVNMAGYTSANTPRPAMTRLATFLRPFGKWRNPSAVPGHADKVTQPAPRAGTMPTWQHGITAPPNIVGAGGANTTRGRGVGRNTFRLIPQPWDVNYIDKAPAARAAAAEAPTRRASGWRAR